MEHNTATFRVELYYRGGAAYSKTKPAVWEVTLAEGADLYLMDKEHDHPNLPHYNFRIVKVGAGEIIFEQIPDRRGQKAMLYPGVAGKTTQLRLEKTKPIVFSPNVPGGGPVWTVSWVTSGTQPETTRVTEARQAYMDYRNVHQFFEVFLHNQRLSVEDAVELLGEKQDESLPQRVVLKPKIPDVARAQLEIGPDNFLEGISIDFARGHYPSVSFAALIRDYGEPRQLPLPPLKITPREPFELNHSYSFDVQRGSLIVTVRGERKEELNPVVGIICRRWQP